jgi:adenosylmethionine-8-amino-7-oxononanoate aminotransferase
MLSDYCAASYLKHYSMNGLYCRADDRGDPVIQLAPPLICGQEQFDEMEQILRHVLTEGQKIL